MEASLDCELKSQYQITVRARSRVTIPPQSSDVNVLILVKDLNDNPPRIHYPSIGNNSIHVNSGSATGSFVMDIKAEDIDHDTTSSDALSYMISSGNQKGLFALSERTGALHTTSSLREHTGERITLLLSVYDQGVPPKRSNSTLTIIIDEAGSVSRKTDEKGIVKDRNLVIVIAIACVTGVIVVLLLVGIVAVLRRRQSTTAYNYKARIMTDQRNLMSGGSTSSANGTGSRRGSLDKTGPKTDGMEHLWPTAGYGYGPTNEGGNSQVSRDKRILVQVYVII